MTTFLIIVAIVIVAILVVAFRQRPTAYAKPAVNPISLQLLSIVKQQAEAHNDATTIQAVLDMTYNGPMPRRKPDGTYTDIYDTILDYNLAGVNFRKKIRDYVGDFDGYLMPEATNKYDPNAIAVYHRDGHHLGYIPENCTDDIRDLGLPFPITVWGDIEEDYDYDDRRKFYRGIVFVEVPNPTATSPMPKNVTNR